jgi:hypothetical protein
MSQPYKRDRRTGIMGMDHILAIARLRSGLLHALAATAGFDGRRGCRHQHSLSFISASCRQRAVLQVQNRHRGAESVVFAVFSAALYPWIATSTVDKKTDGDNHY